ncbi:MAG TPA: ATP-binding protein [Candidatus Limnocylindria bacterium]|nr:ATP-binding protein [Candidatus Limnocylindria bacterium]
METRKRLHDPAASRIAGTLRIAGGLLENPAPRQMNMTGLLTGASSGAVFETSGEALLVLDAEGIIRHANPRACELLRITADRVPGEKLAQFLSPQSARDLATYFEVISLALSVDAVGRKSIDALLSTGFPVRITFRALVPGLGGLLVYVEDGSIVQRADSRWRQTTAELRSVLDSVEAGILLLDPSGRVRFFNDRFAQLSGIPSRRLANLEGFQELDALVAGRFRTPESFAAPWKAFMAGAGAPTHDELQMSRPARRVLERFSRPVLDGDGNPVGWLELYRDVTGDRQIQSNLLQTEKMAALGQLVSGIAHELNNPLTTIMGYAQLLLGHGLLPPQFSEASKVFQEAERARRIVKSLLYVARENKPERTRVNLNEIIERTLALRSYELRVENIVVECELAGDLPETVGDPHQLQQVVLNLLVNAEQSLLQGRGQGRVWIRTQRTSPDKISLEVSDDGPGIPPEIVSRIFDPFFTTKPSGVGTGLGLSIVYGIVQQHDGEVTFENQPGVGAKFLVELPVIALPAVERPRELAAPVEQVRTASMARILVVEDESTVAQLIVDVLREEGHQVEAAADSQDGLRRISRAHYDLVICDLRMPRLDGRAFYEALVAAGSPAQHRILFITGDTLAPRTLEFLAPRALTYLAKPFLVEELNLAVNRMLERNREPGEAGFALLRGNGRSVSPKS